MQGTEPNRDQLWRPDSTVRSSRSPVIVTVAISAVVLIVLFLLYALWGVRAIRSALIVESERNGVALLESILLASQYSITASVLTDQLEWENLATRARLAAEKASQAHVTETDLARLVDLSDADGVTVWNSGGLHSYPDVLDTVVATAADMQTFPGEPGVAAVFPFELTDSIRGGTWNGAGVATDWGGVAIWRWIPAEADKPSWSGIGVLLQEIGRRSDINYIMLQSPDGIVFASRQLPPVLRLADDQFLVDALDDTVAASREITFEGTPVLEVVKPFLSSDLPSGMFRVGLSLTGVEQAQRRLMVQLGLSAFLFLFLAITAIAFLVARRSYGDLSRSYQRVETLTRRILDSIDQAVIASDAGGHVTVYNRAAERLFGRSVEAFERPTVNDVAGENDYALRDVASGGESVHDEEYRYVRGDDARQLVYSTTPVVTSEGRLEGAVSVVRDETEARHLAEQVQRSSRLTEMGNLAAGVAHEIRNPLNAIGIAAQRLQMEIADPEARKMAGTVLEEARRLNTIVENFLSLARASTQPMGDLDLSELVSSVASMAALEAEQRGIGWEAVCVEHCHINGAADDMRKALWNVVSNALGATSEGGKVTVHLDMTGHEAVIRVTDDGQGIPASDVSRVFQPYFTTKDHGTGLGLAITHRIITDHGGTIRIDSPPPGADKGTRVTIELPRMKGGATTRSAV